MGRQGSEDKSKRMPRPSAFSFSTVVAYGCSFSSLLSLVNAVPAPNTIEIVGNSGVSAQQLFLGQSNKVYIIDKTENNPISISGHPAWASEYDLTDNTFRAMDIRTNSFCAGGNVLGNGTWINIGGNQAVGAEGLNVTDGTGPYEDYDGGRATRSFNTCTDETCDWTDDGANYLSSRRWYPTLETLEDGSMIVIGGDEYGGYVNDAGQNNPTYEFYPSRGAPIFMPLLNETLPANLYSLTWILPSGRLFIQTNLATMFFDYNTNTETRLAAMPHAVRTYPGSAATAMMPLTPANNWTAKIMFCGGTNLQPDQWTPLTLDIPNVPADSTCVSMTPDVSTDWVDEEPLPQGRVMGNWIFLPDGRLVLINGIGKGTAGYGNTSFSIGESLGQDPIHAIHYYDPSQPTGSQFSDIIVNSTVDRMYHSSATLLPDGSVFSSGSNPNADFVAPGTPNYTYFTEYRVEKFYPDYYNMTRPAPTGLPTTMTYGGDSFDVVVSASDLANDINNLDQTKVVLIRPGFSTHAINMGQRYVQLNNTFSAHSDGSATLHVSQVPPNPAILVPGPALMFIVVNGVPSIGEWLTVGSGTIEAQPVLATQVLPGSVDANGNPWKSSALGNSSTTSTSSSSPSSSSSSSSSSSTKSTSAVGSSGTGTSSSSSGAISDLRLDQFKAYAIGSVLAFIAAVSLVV